MGYTTDFVGALDITPKVEARHFNYINAFAESRRMKRDVEMLKTKADPLRKAVELPLGNEGEFYIGVDGGFMGQNRTDDIVDYNKPPGQLQYKSDWSDFNEVSEENQRRSKNGQAQPGLWAQWILNPKVALPEGDEKATEPVDCKLQWDGNEKFYNYIEWLCYYINNFFEPWGYKLNGEIKWSGEEPGDAGKIMVKDNVIGVVDMDGNKELIEPITSAYEVEENPKELGEGK